MLAEIWHLYGRKRIASSPDAIRSQVLSASNCTAYPLDESVLSLLPQGLELHDAIIVATALLYRDVLRQPVTLVTRDKQLQQSGLIDVAW